MTDTHTRTVSPKYVVIINHLLLIQIVYPRYSMSPSIVRPSHNFVFSMNTKIETDLLFYLPWCTSIWHPKNLEMCQSRDTALCHRMRRVKVTLLATLYHALQYHVYQLYEQLVHLPAKDGSFDASSVAAFDFVAQLTHV